MADPDDQIATNLSFDDLPCAVLTASRAGNIEAVNSRLSAWTGYTRSELVGSRLSDVLDETMMPARLYCAAGKALDVRVSVNEETASRCRVLVLTREEATRGVAVGSALVSDEAMSTALDDANALLDTIFETAPIGLGVWDKEFRFVRVNKRLAEINGVPPEAHIGKRPDEILPGIDNIDEIYARWREIFKSGESWNNFEVKGATPADPGHIRTWDENFYPVKVKGRVVGIGAVVEETTERKRNLEQVKSLVKELNHRCKNLLSIVLAIARQTSRGGDPNEFISRFTSRIQGLVASHDLLVRDDWTGVAIADLVRGQLAHFEELIGKRITVTGPEVRLHPAAAQGLGMALHELATNAAKYGALSNSSGELEINWDVVMTAGKDPSEPRLVLYWQERGGPPVVAPNRTGFGQLVIGKLLEASVNGETKITFAPDGVVWSLSAPTHGLIET